VDFYSLPNLVQTMRTNRYSLIEEIMETPLLTLEQAFAKFEEDFNDIPDEGVGKEELSHA